MLEHLARYWWVLTVRGVLAIIFGILAVVWPAITLLALAILFGAYVLVNGLFAAIGAVRAESDSRALLVLEAILGILVGLLTLVWPGATLLAVTILIGAWALITGIAQIVTAVRLRKEIRGELLYILAGAVSVLFGLMVLVWPIRGALAVAWIIGIYAILFGILLIALSLRVRRDGRRLGGASSPRAPGTSGGPAASPL
ncbi:MAG: HdeD family acid-resistance protein [Actinomadura sp.]